MDDCQAAAHYLISNMAERTVPWEEVAEVILVVEKALSKKIHRPCDSRHLARVLGHSKDWINDHKRALRVIRAHKIPDGAIPHYKLLRPLGHGVPFAIEETTLQGIVNEGWTIERVYEEVRKRLERSACGIDLWQSAEPAPGGEFGAIGTAWRLAEPVLNSRQTRPPTQGYLACASGG